MYDREGGGNEVTKGYSETENSRGSFICVTLEGLIVSEK